MYAQSRPVFDPLPSWSCTFTGVSSVPTTFEASTRRVIALTIGSSSPAAAGHPVAHRRARQLHAVPLEDRLLAVERQVVGDLLVPRGPAAPVRAGPSRSARGVARRSRRGPARLAAHIWAGHARDDDQAGGHVFQLLADLLADLAGARRRSRDRRAPRGRRRGRPACGAGSPAAACGRGLRTRGFRRRRCRPAAASWRHRSRSGASRTLVREEQELVGVELLALPAVEPAEELLELVLELGDELALLTQGREPARGSSGGRLRGHRAMSRRFAGVIPIEYGRRPSM